MNKRLAASALLLLACVVACSDTPVIEFAKACLRENDGKTLRTQGVLAAPFAALCRTSRRRSATVTTCSFDLRDPAGGDARISLNIAVGDGKSEIDKMRLDARQGAAAVRDGDGRFLADRAKIAVTGTLRAVQNTLKPDETVCWIDVDRIDRQ